MNKKILISLLVGTVLFAQGNFEKTAALSPNEANSILKAFYEWLIPKDTINLALRQQWVRGLSGWEKTDQAQCGVFEQFVREKSASMEKAADLLKNAAVISSSSSTKSYEQRLRDFIEHLLEKIRKKINIKIKEKSLKEDQALLVMFREVFSIGKQLVAKLIDAHSGWEEEKGKEKKDNKREEQKQPELQRGFAFHKYMQLELFFTKCALRMHEIRNGRPQLVLMLSYPNTNNFFDEPYFDENIPVQWQQQNGADSDDEVLTRDLLSLDQAAGMIALLQTFIGNLCSKSFTGGITSWFSNYSKQQPTVEVPDIGSLYECANKNGVQFSKLFELLTEEVKQKFNDDDLAQELLLYELHRIRQRLEDIGKDVELSEQRKIRALLAAMAKYGAKMVRDLVDKVMVNELKMTGTGSAKSAFLLDKYHYADMAEWFEAVHKKMKRHIKYHVNAIVYAPNGIRVQPFWTPKIDGKLVTIDAKSKFLKKIALTADVQLIANMIEYGEIALENEPKNTVGIEETNLCAGKMMMKTFVNGLDIAQAMEELVLGSDNSLLMSLKGNISLQCKVELTVIYGAAIEYASKFKTAWHQKAAQKLDMLIGHFWGLHLAESSVAKALGAHECTSSWDGRKTAELKRKVGQIMKFYDGEEAKKPKEQQLKNEEENIGEVCKFSMNPGIEVVRTLIKLKSKFGAIMKKNNNNNNIILLLKKLDTVIDELRGKFVKLEELHGSLQRILLAHTEHPRQIQHSDAKLIREAVHLQDAELKLLRQYALEEIHKLELDIQMSAKEKGNLIEFGTNNENAIVRLEHFKFASYNHEGKPSNERSSIKFPGELRFISGSLKMSEKLEQSFMATAKFSLKFCLPVLPCVSVCKKGKSGGMLGNFVEEILRQEILNKREDKQKEIQAAAAGAATTTTTSGNDDKKGELLTEEEEDEIKAKLLKFETKWKCTTNFLFHKEIFNLGTIAFTERIFHDMLAQEIRTNNVADSVADELEANVTMAGMMEPEEGFIELPSLLSKNIFKMLPYVNGATIATMLERMLPKTAKLKFGVEVTEFEEENEEEGGGGDNNKMPLLFGGRPIVSLKFPATKGYLEVKLV